MRRFGVMLGALAVAVTSAVVVFGGGAGATSTTVQIQGSDSFVPNNKIESTFQFTNTTTYRRTENGTVTTVVENCVGTYDPVITTNGITTLAFAEKGSENTQCGVQLSPTGVGGRTRNYGGTWDGANTLTADFDITTHSVYSK